MKLVFLAASFTILYYMKYHKQVRHTYDKEQDTFRRLFLVVPAAVLGLALPYEYTFREVSVCTQLTVGHSIPDITTRERVTAHYHITRIQA